MAQAPPSPPRSARRQLKDALLAVAIALAVSTFGVTVVGVSGQSMAPTLSGSGGRERLLVLRYEAWLRRAGLAPGYRRGEIVVFREPPTSPFASARPSLLVKRIIGLPGDRISMVQGRVFINGTELEQSFITAAGGDLGLSSLMPTTVPDGHYFVLGDNRRSSVDSRVFGAIPAHAITGRVAAVIWPRWRALTPPAAFAQLAADPP